MISNLSVGISAHHPCLSTAGGARTGIVTGSILLNLGLLLDSHQHLRVVLPRD